MINSKIPISLLIASIVFTTLLAVVYHNFSIYEQTTQHALLADDLFIKFKQKLRTYEQIGFGAKGLIESSEYVDWYEWQTYAKSQHFDERFDDSLTLAYAPKITHDQLPSFVNSMDGVFTEYNIHPFTDNDVAYPIKYLAPITEKLQSVLGFDNGSDQTRRWCIEQSRDTGKTVLSDPFILNPDNSLQHSATMCIPIYEKDQNPKNMDERKKYFEGVVLLTFDLNPLISNIYKSGIEEFNMKIYDVSDSKILVYDHAHENHIQSAENTFNRTYQFGMFEKDWQVEIVDADSSGFPTGLIVALVIGYSISFGFYYFIKQYYYLKVESEREKLQTIGALSTRLAHDLRNPLSVIQMTFDNFRLKYPLNEEQLKPFEKINRAILRVTHQIDDVLDYVRKQELYLIKSKISDILADALDSMYLPSNIVLKLPKNDAEIVCDPKKLSVVFTNLILNAIQAISDSGVVEIRLKENVKNVVIQVEDSGKGMTVNVMKHIFEPLFTTKQQGTGLGLASVKSIIDAHRGKISVTSPPTIFTVTLPKNLTL